jgi:hypothetical protein
MLGNATNYLKFDRDHNWKTFCVSNGTSKPIAFVISELEYRTDAGWTSAGDLYSSTFPKGAFMTRHESSGEVLSGSNDVFYATVPSTNIPWRLHVVCFESSWQDTSLAKQIGSAISGRSSPTNTKSWSGARYELIGDEVRP